MKKEYYILIAIFLIVFGTRLHFAFQTPHFSSDDSYYTVRQINHITKTGLPITNDSLSYSGKTLSLPPLFYYILAVFNLIFNIEFVAKFFPNLFASSVVFVVYLISKELTNNKRGALLAAFAAGFIPVFFSKTLNSASVFSLVAPIMFFSLYCMLRINEDKRFVSYFIMSLLILRLTTPFAAILIITLLIYLLFITLENIKPTRAELELILFSTFMILWTLFLNFKKALLKHGIAAIWQNIPKQVLSQYFSQINIVTAIYFIGIIPFIFGIYVIYRYIFREKNRKMYLIISFAFLISIMLWLRLIEVEIGMIFLGIVLVLLFSQSYKLLFLYINKTKIARYKSVFPILLFILLFLTSVLPSITMASKEIKNAYSQEEIDAFLWIKENTNENDVIVSGLEEGNLVATIANRKNVMDSNFMFVDNINQRLYDLDTIYKTPSETVAIALLNKYNISYIYLSERTKHNYNIGKPDYIGERCFKSVFSNSKVEIYKSLCILEQK
ncbi:MAG: glycosyltransferase family 39 protein [Nanoarchaeota archaeon]|nr:glycosyltransferase family 39 protein [Nanoarchaeota archaeon]